MIQRAIALFVIIFFLPLFLFVSLLILLNDGFPVFYVQENYGLNHKKFFLYKFRTMKKNTPELPTEEFSDAKSYILPYGNFLRKYSIDELPQLINILFGQMKFIGPRPCMVKNEDIVKKLREEKGIQKIMPGITGWAQVNGRDLNSYEEKVNLDYYYMVNKGFILDLKIIFKTIRVVIFKVGIKH
tara:strand:- start:13903 stop:14457 length:555 start_codon:yes stop_codon:yes gene_type:complete